MVQLWQKDLARVNPKAAESLANPEEYPNLFPNLQAIGQGTGQYRNGQYHAAIP